MFNFSHQQKPYGVEFPCFYEYIIWKHFHILIVHKYVSEHIETICNWKDLCMYDFWSYVESLSQLMQFLCDWYCIDFLLYKYG